MKVTLDPSLYSPPDALTVLGESLMDRDAGAAIAYFECASNLGSGRAAYRLGKMRLASGEYGDAVRMLRRALRLTPGHMETLYQLAKAEWLCGQAPRALRHVQAVLKEQPTNPAARRLKVRILVESGRRSAALRELTLHATSLNSKEDHALRRELERTIGASD